MEAENHFVRFHHAQLVCGFTHVIAVGLKTLLAHPQFLKPGLLPRTLHAEVFKTPFMLGVLAVLGAHKHDRTKHKRHANKDDQWG